MKQNIVITGEGILCAIGLNKSEVLSSLREKRSGIGTMKYLKSIHKELPVGEVPLSNDDMRSLLLDGAEGGAATMLQQRGPNRRTDEGPERRGEEGPNRRTDEEPERRGEAMVGHSEVCDGALVNRSTLMGILAVRQALEDAHVDASLLKEKTLRLVLVSGTTVGGMDVTENVFRRLEQCDEALECLKYHSVGSCTRMMAEYFGFFSEYTTISTACSSAANALMLGARMLAEGEADIVVAGGTEALTLFHLNGFNSLMILDHEQCRPFDASRGGLNLGEGAAFCVMETEEGAAARGAVPHAWVEGYGNACDAFHQTASSESGEGAYLAMREALDMAGLKGEDIDYVNGHGTGTRNNDSSEAAALQRVFGAEMPPVSSTKGFTGHTTSASGGIEAVISILALREGFVPANFGWREAMEGGFVPTAGKERSALRYVLSNSFGFGGNDTSLVFGKAGEDWAEGTEWKEGLQQCCSKGDRAEGTEREKAIRIVSRVEVTSEEELAEIRKYVAPMEARRMGKLMKSSLLASLKALQKAGISQPDAIVTATAYGSMENSEQLLRALTAEGEVMLKPTAFMQSTHNTTGSHIAIWLGCHGYNVTYSQDEDSMKWAMRDAERLLRSGRCKTVLVGCHDESTPLFRELMGRLGRKDIPAIHSLSMVLSLEERE